LIACKRLQKLFCVRGKFIPQIKFLMKEQEGGSESLVPVLRYSSVFVVIFLAFLVQVATIHIINNNTRKIVNLDFSDGFRS
jgi:hypothetical protein